MMTEYCGSVSFGKYLEEVPIDDPRDICEFYSGVLQIAHALDEMSEKNIVHMDLHFDNIMFPKYEEVCKKECKALRFENIVVGRRNRLVKIFDWDRSLNLAKDLQDREYLLLHDKIGFLRQLVSFSLIPMQEVVPEVNNFVEFVENTVYRQGSRAYPQMTDMNILYEYDVAILKIWVDAAISSVKTYSTAQIRRILSVR